MLNSSFLGIFLIPYFVMLALVGLPFYVLEMSLGQFTSLSVGQCWECAPCMKGVGWAMAYITFVITLYYNVIIAWALYYFAKSLTSDLPWDKCREYFAGDCK